MARMTSTWKNSSCKRGRCGPDMDLAQADRNPSIQVLPVVLVHNRRSTPQRYPSLPWDISRAHPRRQRCSIGTAYLFLQRRETALQVFPPQQVGHINRTIEGDITAVDARRGREQRRADSKRQQRWPPQVRYGMKVTGSPDVVTRPSGSRASNPARAAGYTSLPVSFIGSSKTSSSSRRRPVISTATSMTGRPCAQACLAIAAPCS